MFFMALAEVQIFHYLVCSLENQYWPCGQSSWKRFFQVIQGSDAQAQKRLSDRLSNYCRWAKNQWMPFAHSWSWFYSAKDYLQSVSVGTFTKRLPLIKWWDVIAHCKQMNTPPVTLPYVAPLKPFIVIWAIKKLWRCFKDPSLVGRLFEIWMGMSLVAIL